MVLFTTDVLGHATTLVQVVLGSLRLQEHLPSNLPRVTQLHFGPKSPLFSYPVTVCLYTGTAAASLLLLAFRRQAYFRHRLCIVLGVRMVRLTVQVATLATPSAAYSLAAAVAARMLQVSPRKAAAMLVIQPMVYYSQAAMLLLPWKLSLACQLAITGAMLGYFWQFPCYLQQHLQDAASAAAHASTPAWRGRAELSCGRLQSLAALAVSAVGGGSLSDFSPGVCEGISSVQMLQIFWTLVCLLIGPVFASYEWERWMHARCAGQQPPLPAGASAARGSGTDSISSSGSAGSSSSSGGGDRATHSSRPGEVGSSSGGSSGSSARPPGLSSRPVARDFLLDLAEAGVQEGSEWGGVFLRVLLLAVSLPVVWLLSELLAAHFAVTRDCPALLEAAGVT